jgi:DNA-binding transcriptional MerR regulator
VRAQPQGAASMRRAGSSQNSAAHSGYRVYPQDVLDVLHFVTQARRLGLTLAEIGSIIALRCAKPGPCAHVRTLLERKLVDLDGLRRELHRILDSWDASSQRRGVVCQHIEGPATMT